MWRKFTVKHDQKKQIRLLPIFLLMHVTCEISHEQVNNSVLDKQAGFEYLVSK